MAVQDPAKVARAQGRIQTDSAGPDLARLRDVLCEPSRLRIVEALGSEELSVGDLAAAIDRKVPATSQHLRVLRELGVVDGTRRATTVWYRLRPGLTTRLVLQLVRSLTDNQRAGAVTPSHPDGGPRGSGTQ